MKQCFSNDRKLYKSKDIPGGGTFDLEDNPKDIYTLLRALDYGKSDVFPMVTTQYHGERVRVRRYKKVDTADVRPDEYKIYLPLEDNKFLMLRIDKLQNIGGLGGVIDDIEYLHWMIHELKQVTRRLVSNLYIADDEIQKLIDTKKILYEYVPGAYLNFWYGEQGFVRLFFYTVNIDVYKAPFIKGEVVCELFFAKEMADNEVVERSFIEKGFERYSVYHKWTRKKITTSIGSLSADYDVTYNQSDGFDEGIRACFDLYSDHVPDHDNMKRFLRQNTLYAFRKNGETIAGLVVSENGKIQTEEFIFVKPDFRGQGLARQLHETWDRDAQKVGALCVAWIRDDNEASIKLHEQLGYIRQEVHKITLKKGIIKNG
jgi:GNAT superfamily N-acetyltransferase